MAIIITNILIILNNNNINNTDTTMDTNTLTVCEYVEEAT